MTYDEICEQFRLHDVTGKGPGWATPEDIATRVIGMISIPGPSYAGSSTPRQVPRVTKAKK